MSQAIMGNLVSHHVKFTDSDESPVGLQFFFQEIDGTALQTVKALTDQTAL